jgi:hypothetical protein
MNTFTVWKIYFSCNSTEFFILWDYFLKLKKGSSLFEEDLIQSWLDLFRSIRWIWYSRVYSLRNGVRLPVEVHHCSTTAVTALHVYYHVAFVPVLCSYIFQYNSHECETIVLNFHASLRSKNSVQFFHYLISHFVPITVKQSFSTDILRLNHSILIYYVALSFSSVASVLFWAWNIFFYLQ